MLLSPLPKDLREEQTTNSIDGSHTVTPETTVNITVKMIVIPFVAGDEDLAEAAVDATMVDSVRYR